MNEQQRREVDEQKELKKILGIRTFDQIQTELSKRMLLPAGIENKTKFKT